METYVIYEDEVYTTKEFFKKFGYRPTFLPNFTLQDDESAVLMRFLEGHWIRVTPMECLRYLRIGDLKFKENGQKFIYINC